MRAVLVVDKNVLELNYMWLPTFIGMNSALKQSMEKDLQESLKGTVLDEHGLDKAHDIVVEYLAKTFSYVKGLEKYLDAMKYLET